MAINKESTPPPLIGKAGRYTVFLTPPKTPSPSPKPQSQSQQLKSESPKVQSIVPPPPPSPSPLAPPPVQPPPQQFEKSANNVLSSSAFGFFWNAVAKVQNAHSSLDGYLAEWFGLDHSKYQWALDDYYESKGMVKGDTKSKEITSKGQSV
ncbi:hypothetical protein AQUCO_02400130v1 [Aquilegia coerulea]|uniref:Uncharacterized protein n=1 Tax=Aquilegia coerulea TaxID=218851 RepID=A0A2G5DBL8_AQUCA|nr:hypothetical protein AQUCO_02400130v1 [Aquilegia coerulea]